MRKFTNFMALFTPCLYEKELFASFFLFFKQFANRFDNPFPQKNAKIPHFFAILPIISNFA